MVWRLNSCICMVLRKIDFDVLLKSARLRYSLCNEYANAGPCFGNILRNSHKYLPLSNAIVEHRFWMARSACISYIQCLAQTEIGDVHSNCWVCLKSLALTHCFDLKTGLRASTDELWATEAVQEWTLKNGGSSRMKLVLTPFHYPAGKIKIKKKKT